MPGRRLRDTACALRRAGRTDRRGQAGSPSVRRPDEVERTDRGDSSSPRRPATDRPDSADRRTSLERDSGRELLPGTLVHELLGVLVPNVVPGMDGIARPRATTQKGGIMTQRVVIDVFLVTL